METKCKNYPDFAQRVYQYRLDNGMEVVLLPMADFHKTYAVLTSNYGAANSSWINGAHGRHPAPAGIAHFLEHKLFEKKDHDAFDLFGAWGADSNAFTSYTQTSYQFSTTSHLKENLNILLDFVQEPYFSAAGVKKEQGIIDQEIRMYRDNPDSCLYNGMVANLYPQDPMHIDIAGTEESIQQITPDILYEHYRLYYQPSNLKLVIAGKLDPEQVMEWINGNQSQKHFDKVEHPQTTVQVRDPKGQDVITSSQKVMAVERPRVMVGIRGTSSFTSIQDRLKYKLACELLLEMLIDDTTDNYLRLYNQGLLDDSFTFSFEMDRGFHFATFSTESLHGRQFAESLAAIINDSQQQLAQMASHFAAMKRGALGRLIASINAPEYIANPFASSLYGDLNIFDAIACLQTISLNDLEVARQRFLDHGVMSSYFILPSRS